MNSGVSSATTPASLEVEPLAPAVVHHVRRRAAGMEHLPLGLDVGPRGAGGDDLDLDVGHHALELVEGLALAVLALGVGDGEEGDGRRRGAARGWPSCPPRRRRREQPAGGRCRRRMPRGSGASCAGHASSSVGCLPTGLPHDRARRGAVAPEGDPRRGPDEVCHRAHSQPGWARPSSEDGAPACTARRSRDSTAATAPAGRLISPPAADPSPARQSSCDLPDRQQPWPTGCRVGRRSWTCSIARARRTGDQPGDLRGVLRGHLLRPLIRPAASASPAGSCAPWTCCP